MRKVKRKMTHPEFDLQCKVAFYLKSHYADAMFLSEAISNVKLTMPQQARNKKIQDSNFACPDMMVFHPSDYYKGLFLELKVKSPYKKDGTLLKTQNNHLEGQQHAIDRLNKLGYCALFAWDLEDIKKIIDNYFENYLVTQKK